MTGRGEKREGRDEGASIVILAISMVLLLGIAAVAVDLAGLRLDRRSDRLATDAAVTAGVLAMNPFAGTGAPEACKMAWSYLQENLADGSTSPPPAGCDTVLAGTCDPATAREVTATFGPYSAVITHPVPYNYVDSLGVDLMGSQTPEPLIDGEACQRIAVSLQRTRAHTFARVLGFDTGSTVVRSVGRVAAEAGESEVVPLLVLEPRDCPALFTSGQGKVTVSFDTASETPGFMVVDSDASTCGPSNPYSIDSMGNQKGWIRAIPVPNPPTPSAILSFALAGPNWSASYDPGDLSDPVDPADITDPSEPVESWFRLYPQPQAISERITRAPIDWRYNCKTNYPGYLLDASDPSAGTIQVNDCPDVGSPGTDTYIDKLVASYTGMGQPFGNLWTSSYPCTVASDISVTGNWYVDCPGGFVVNGTMVTFGGSNLVFDGGIDLRSTAALNINQGAGNSQNYFVYVRDGIILKRAQASLVLDHTMVYLENGAVDLRAGDGGLTWTAPVGPTIDPVSGDTLNFEDLALWSEAHIPHEIGGQAGNTLTGTFFTPYAEPFGLTGQGGQFQFEAQFITRRLELKGQGEVKMIPDPDKTTPIPIRAAKLIR